MKRAVFFVLVVGTVLALLLAALAWAIDVPEPHDLRQATGEGTFRVAASETFDFYDEPRYVVFRGVCELVIHRLGYRWSILLAFILALTWLTILLRVLRRSSLEPGQTGYCLLATLAALWVFSPSLGSDWLAAPRFRLFVPPLCFTAAAALLQFGHRWFWRFWSVCLLCVIAVFTDRSALWLWPALLPFVFIAARTQQRHAVPAGAIFALCGNLATVLCHWRVEDPFVARPGLLAQIWDAPATTAQQMLLAMGSTIGDVRDGTSDQDLAGAFLLVLVVVAVGLALRHRRELGASGLFAAALLTFGFLQILLHVQSFPPERPGATWVELRFGVANEQLVGARLLPIGTCMLLLTLARWRRAVLVCLWLLLAFALASLPSGWTHLRAMRQFLVMQEAQMVFADVATHQLPSFPRPAVVFQLLRRDLPRRGLARRVAPAESLRLDQWTLLTVDDVLASVTSMQPTEATGTMRQPWLGVAPELILLTRSVGTAPEIVFEIVAPPFLVGAEEVPWHVSFDPPPAFAAGEVVRAYAFDLQRRCVMPLGAPFRYGNGRFER